MKWLADSDGAGMEQARMLAGIIDAAHAAGEVSRELRAHGALTRILDELGGTPRVRLQLELRSRRFDVERPSTGAQAGSNVVRFPRPQKRRR
ncbi:hypothetical protein SAMN04487846_2260 [Microbacterium sp. cf046]|uniref:terminase small subunit n=1 Tax=Microbacterium sp. cf046 TaxID=1761803 RepID=UPI0008EAC95E|nr:hypothetical protein [Microbacterium sp. cf046]SFS07611.1 hypothetical protein SAMN04487846_2260 [Microbacterium sp. cf046]